MKKTMSRVSGACFITSGLIFISLFVHGFYALATKNYMTTDQAGMYFTATIALVLIGGMIETIKDAFF